MPDSADDIQNQLNAFYEERANQMQTKEEEFTLEQMYGKRSAKELEFLRRLEKSMKKDMDLANQLGDLTVRWNTGAGKPKKKRQS